MNMRLAIHSKPSPTSNLLIASLTGMVPSLDSLDEGLGSETSSLPSTRRKVLDLGTTRGPLSDSGFGSTGRAESVADIDGESTIVPSMSSWDPTSPLSWKAEIEKGDMRLTAFQPFGFSRSQESVTVRRLTDGETMFSCRPLYLEVEFERKPMAMLVYHPGLITGQDSAVARLEVIDENGNRPFRGEVDLSGAPTLGKIVGVANEVMGMPFNNCVSNRCADHKKGQHTGLCRLANGLVFFSFTQTNFDDNEKQLQDLCREMSKCLPQAPFDVKKAFLGGAFPSGTASRFHPVEFVIQVSEDCPIEYVQRTIFRNLKRPDLNQGESRVLPIGYEYERENGSVVQAVLQGVLPFHNRLLRVVITRKPPHELACVPFFLMDQYSTKWTDTAKTTMNYEGLVLGAKAVCRFISYCSETRAWNFNESQLAFLCCGWIDESVKLLSGRSKWSKEFAELAKDMTSFEKTGMLFLTLVAHLARLAKMNNNLDFTCNYQLDYKVDPAETGTSLNKNETGELVRRRVSGGVQDGEFKLSVKDAHTGRVCSTQSVPLSQRFIEDVTKWSSNIRQIAEQRSLLLTGQEKVSMALTPC